MTEQELNNIQKLIKYTFKDPSWLHQILYFMDGDCSKEAQENFQKFVFLGKSLLEFIVSKRAFDKLGHLKEGALSRLRFKLTKDECCANYLSHTQLADQVPCLKTYFDRYKKNEQTKPFADFLKALIAAIHQDGGIDASYAFFSKRCLPAAKSILQDRNYFNWRQKVHDLCMKLKRGHPKYLVLEESGPEHAKSYTMGLFLEDELLAKSEGSTKKKAADLAASVAFNKIQQWEIDQDFSEKELKKA